MADPSSSSNEKTAANNNVGSSTSNEQSLSSKICEPDKELLEEALQSMQHGKRHMIVSDYRSAVPCFETACEFLGHLYGLRALECAEAYLNYGIALYELSRLEEGLDGGINEN
ncbi:hypothetical protein BLA29_011649 [Euroglyphus maynei]|uniref:Uncharacterized protein n=1 Tax=Euroglyphus maynei TaxID=6958 RepID=A0A1Y3AZD4_EURMA|nr:hypothetical protein BLA29_011649 [Euroglyphus maynei]